MQPGVRIHSQHWCPTRENHHHAVRKSSAPPPSFVTPICWSSVFLRSGAVRFSLRRVCTYVPCERESPCDPHRDPHPQSNCLALLRVSQRVTRHAIHLRTLATPKIRKKVNAARQAACLPPKNYWVWGFAEHADGRQHRLSHPATNTPISPLRVLPGWIARRLLGGEALRYPNLLTSRLESDGVLQVPLEAPVSNRCLPRSLGTVSSSRVLAALKFGCRLGTQRR